MSETYGKSYLADAATAALVQATHVPGAGVPVDPDVADFMGAFPETALTLDDLQDDALLTTNEAGEVSYVEH